MKNRIYLDANATTPLRPEVIALATRLLAEPHNASSAHSFGREGRKAIETAREQIARLTGAPASQIIFNSGATEGNNTVLHHFRDERILVSAIEHPSVLEAAPQAEKIPVTAQGLIDLDALETLLRDKKTGLVSVMAVNNETGVIQPVAQASALAHRYGALFHCDAVQAAGKIPLDITALGVDFLTLSSHKIGGPQGAGALVLGLCGITPTLLLGGGQEKTARAGTENVAAIAGFGLAAECAQTHLPAFQETAALRDRMEQEIMRLAPSAIIHGASAPRVANTTLFSLPGLRAETLLMAFDLEGIALSNGSACSSGRIGPSHVLRAMDVPESQSASALRISSSWATTPEELDTALHILQRILARMQDRMA